MSAISFVYASCLVRERKCADMILRTTATGARALVLMDTHAKTDGDEEKCRAVAEAEDVDEVGTDEFMMKLKKPA